MSNEVWVAILCTNSELEQPYKLPEYCSTFQYEICVAARSTTTVTTQTQRVNISIDNQAATKAVIAVIINSI